MYATWEELREYLNVLAACNDDRLQDSILVYNPENGEYKPAEYVELSSCDEVLDDERIVMMPHDWNESFDEE